VKTVDVLTAAGWRSWLVKNHLNEEGVWLVFHKGGAPSLLYDDALDEALAYGWIDSVRSERSTMKNTGENSLREDREVSGPAPT